MSNFQKSVFSKKGLFIYFLLILSVNSFSATTDGYIVALNNDTIYGKVQVSRFDQLTGNLILNGIEEESYHTRVTFAPRNSNRFKTYFTEMILGFGFTYKSTTYTYRRIEVKKKSLFNRKNIVYKFAKVINE